MSVVKGPTTLTGEVGLKPVVKRMTSTDNLATITAAGYLNTNLNEGNDLKPSDLMLVIYNYDEVADTGDIDFFSVSISNGVISLAQDISGGNVTLPVVAGDFANFDGTTGKLKDSGFSASDATKTKVVMANAAVIVDHIATYSDTAGTLADDAATAINGGNIQAGLDGTAGKFVSFPATTASGSLQLQAVDNTNNSIAVIKNEGSGLVSTDYILPNPEGTPTYYLQCSLVNSNVSPNMFSFNILVDAINLAGGGQVDLITPALGSYVIHSLNFNAGGTNFSGGGGDRLLHLTDGTTVYSIVAAADLATLTNQTWGDVKLPFPAAAW